MAGEKDKFTWDSMKTQMQKCRAKMYATSQKMAAYAGRQTDEAYRVKVLACSTQLQGAAGIMQDWIEGMEENEKGK